jgi:serine/threonine protein kinase
VLGSGTFGTIQVAFYKSLLWPVAVKRFANCKSPDFENEKSMMIFLGGKHVLQHIKSFKFDSGWGLHILEYGSFGSLHTFMKKMVSLCFPEPFTFLPAKSS